VPSDFLAPAGSQGQGLHAEYFLNTEFSGTPEIDRTDPYAAINGGFFLFEGFEGASPHFPKQPGILSANVSIRWTGTLTAPVAGAYQLALTSTGTSRLFVDGTQVVATVATAVGETPITNMAPLVFAAGSVHDVRIEFASDAPQSPDGGPQFKFGWIPPAGVIAPQAKAAADLARTAQVAVVVVRDFASEFGDKPNLRLPNGQEDLILQVAAANPHTIVVINAAGAVQTSNWDSAVPAILHAWYGGQEQGGAIARILFGDVNPSGKLPITMPVDDSKTPISTPAQFPGTVKGKQLDQQLSEGIFVGYRGYEQSKIQPQYPFGHGLSYTTYTYSNLRTTPTSVILTVTNSGQVAGSEVVQVYAGNLPTPLPTAPKSLAGFTKVALQPGESKDVTIALDPDSLSYWDVATHAWVKPSGTVPIMVGASSADIRLNGTVESAAATPTAAPATAVTAHVAPTPSTATPASQ
jgi:beta-glucosidase